MRKESVRVAVVSVVLGAALTTAPLASAKTLGKDWLLHTAQLWSRLQSLWRFEEPGRRMTRDAERREVDNSAVEKNGCLSDPNGKPNCQ